MNKEDVVKRIMKNYAKDSKRNFSNSMTTSEGFINKFWRPHNFRRGIQIKSFDNSMFSKKGFIHGTTIPYNKCLHTKIISIKYSDNLTIQIFKNNVHGEWKQVFINGERETILLKGKSLNEIDRKIIGLKRHVHKLIEDAVNLVISKVGFIVVGDFFYVRGENWTRGDHWVEKLPRDCIIHEEHWKKVYPYGIEIIGGKGEDSIELFKQHIHNSIVYDFAPLIAKEMVFNRMLAYDIKAWCEVNISCLDDFNKYADLVKGLTLEQREGITEWIFERFNSLKGGVSL